MLVWFSVCWGQAILLLQPQYGGALIQAVQNGANAFTPLVILLVLLVANALLTMGQQALVAKIAERLARRIRGHLVHSFLPCRPWRRRLGRRVGILGAL